MTHPKTQSKRRNLVVVNYLSLVVMNVCFTYVFQQRDASHIVDAVGISAFFLVIATFIPTHVKSGLWKLTHADAAVLDERELQLTHNTLGRAYAGFTVICLAIIMTHAVLFRLVSSLDFLITIPLATSLIYLAHTLPGTILAWTELEVPGDLS